MNRKTIIAAAGVTTGATIGAEYYLRRRDRLYNRDRWFHEEYDGSQPYKVFHNRSGWELMPGYNVAGIRINQYGFRGDDFSKQKESDVERIICLGDSCTFGLAGDEAPYPFQLQQTLDAKGLQTSYQTINAGVEGHASINALLRLPWLLTFRPDILIVNIGWNDLWTGNPKQYTDLCRKVQSYWHYGDGNHSSLMLVNSLRNVLGLNGVPPAVNAFDMDNFVPANFEFNMRQIIQLGKKDHVCVVLTTLPTLLPSDAEHASLGILEKIHYPPFFSHGDIEGLQKLYTAYNTSIRRLAVEEDVHLIDLNVAFNEYGAHRDRYFSDIRHPNLEGNKIIAQTLAAGLADRDVIR